MHVDAYHSHLLYSEVSDSSRLIESQEEMCHNLQTIISAHEQQIDILTTTLQNNATTYGTHLEELDRRIKEDQELYQAAYQHSLQGMT